MLEFGDKKEGVQYVDRPSAYVIIRNEKGEVAFAEVKGKYFLPGGGIDAGESAEQAAIREAMEEIGAEIILGRVIGQFGSYATDERKGQVLYWYKIGTYFEAKIVAFHGQGIESDHVLAWLSPELILTKSMPRAHRHAVQEYLKDVANQSSL